jgi:hypothetical protein
MIGSRSVWPSAKVDGSFWGVEIRPGDAVIFVADRKVLTICQPESWLPALVLDSRRGDQPA